MDKVFITIDMLDIEKTDINLTDEGKLTFRAESHGQKYGFDLELFKGVIKSESGWNLKGRNVIFRLVKQDDDRSEYWPRLTKDKIKNQKIQVDWSKWVDEDEVDDAPPMDDDAAMQGFGGDGMDGMGGMGGMDMSKLKQMMAGGGAGAGMGGMEADSDDEDDDEKEAEGAPKNLADLDGEVE